MRRWLALAAVVAAMAVCGEFTRGQELLINGGLELEPLDQGGSESAPPGWVLEEGPQVPSEKAPSPQFPLGGYLGDYDNGGAPTVPCPDRTCYAVNAADYVVWRQNVGQSVPLPNRHPNLSGAINDNDYTVWKMRFGYPYAMSLAEPSNFTHLALEGFWQVWFQPYNGTEAEQEDNYAHLTQTVPGTPGLQYTMEGWALFEDYFPGGVNNLNLEVGGVPTGAPFNDGPVSPTDTFFGLDFLDSNGNVLAGSKEIELKAAGQPSTTSWMKHTLVGVAPPGTANVRVRATMLDGVYNPLPSPQVFQMSFFVDAFSLTAAPAAGFAAGAGVVPEPAGGLSAVIALVAWGLTRRRSN